MLYIRNLWCFLWIYLYENLIVLTCKGNMSIPFPVFALPESLKWWSRSDLLCLLTVGMNGLKCVASLNKTLCTLSCKVQIFDLFNFIFIRRKHESMRKIMKLSSSTYGGGFWTRGHCSSRMPTLMLHLLSIVHAVSIALEWHVLAELPWSRQHI